MRTSWLPPPWRGRQRIHHPVEWTRLPEFDVGIALVQTKANHGHENRWYLYVRKFNENDVKAFPVLASTVITSSPGTTQTITSDTTWNNNSYSIEVIGAGARGAHGASTSTSGGGGGGGAYTKIDSGNVVTTITTPGTTPYYARVGGTTATDGTAGGDTWWTLSSPGTAFPSLGQMAVGAKGGAALASATSATGGAGGSQAGSYPSGGGEVRNSGGNGANAGASATAGGGGGGASGIGIGNNGSGTAGGAGNTNTGGGGTAGTAGSPGGAGGVGTNIQTGPNVGSGGGGGGGNAAPSIGGAGGLYGGGGGGGGRSNGTGGQGAQGVIVLTWSPLYSGSLVTTEAATTAVITGKVEWLASLAATETADIAALTATAFTPVTGSMAATEDWQYELLLHFEGADASTTFPDSGGKSQTVTPHGAAQLDTASTVFGVSSLLLGADADYLSVDTGSFDFGTGDFTIDFWVKLSSGSEARMFFDGGSGGFKIYHDGTNTKFESTAGTITGSGPGSGNDTHYAATRSAGSTRLFKNGTQTGSTLSDTTNYTATTGYPRMGGSGVAGITAGLAATEASDTTAFTAAVSGGYDAATTAWIAAVGSSNVDGAHAGYVDALVVGLKADGLWTKCDRIWLFAAQNTNSAYCDLKAPTTAAFAVGSPTFTADRGFTLSPSGYVRLTYDPVADASAFTQDACHFSIWNLTSGADANPVFNYVGGVANLHIYPEYSGGDCYCRVNEASTAAFTISGANGFLLGNRSDASTVQAYKNGTALGGSPKSVASTTRTSQQLNIYNRQIAAFTIGGSLNSTEQLALYNRLRTYMNNVGVP